MLRDGMVERRGVGRRHRVRRPLHFDVYSTLCSWAEDLDRGVWSKMASRGWHVKANWEDKFPASPRAQTGSSAIQGSRFCRREVILDRQPSLRICIASMDTTYLALLYRLYSLLS